jgi:hypothetical protein
MTGGARVAVRERGGVSGVGLILGELGRLDPGCGPSGLLASFFYFFSFCFLFLLFLKSVLSF